MKIVALPLLVIIGLTALPSRAVLPRPPPRTILEHGSNVFPTAALPSGDTFKFADHLFPNQFRTNSACANNLTMQSDGNLVVYNNGSTAMWASNTMNTGGYAVMQTDGNLVVYDWNDVPVFASNTSDGTRGLLFATLQDDANFCMYTRTGEAATWCKNRTTLGFAGRGCSGTAPRTRVFYDATVVGDNFANGTLPRASWCGFFCSQNSFCTAYTFTPVASGGGVCQLHSVVTPVPTRVAGAVTGIILNDQ